MSNGSDGRPDGGKDWVSPQWLAEHLSAPDVVVLDGSWHMPDDKRDARAEHLAERIPGSLFFDIDAIADLTTDLPHMLPSPDDFARAVGAMGIGDGMRVIVYDTHGVFSAPRVWWTFRAMGFSDVAVLDGGLPKWKAEGHPTESGPLPARPPRRFSARLMRDWVCDWEAVRQNIETGRCLILDTRSAERFRGEVPEPREGIRSGHMPGARNLPYGDLLQEDGTFKSPEALRQLFQDRGIDLSRPIITTCGSGITASILALALALVGHRQTAVYDGSWTEWGGRHDLPIVTGP